jgi:hypothetical protein
MIARTPCLTTKLEKYFRPPSVQYYLIVWADQRRVVHPRRACGSVATMVHTEGTITLDPPGLPFDVAALYAEAAA